MNLSNAVIPNRQSGAGKSSAKSVILYLLLGLGGLWHLLGIFSKTMQLLAGPMLIGITVWMVFEGQKGFVAAEKRRFLMYAVGIVVTGFFLEWFGATTGWVFGQYSYSEALQPQISGVPVAIGFAWLGLVLSAAGVVLHFFPEMSQRRLVLILASGVLMVFFDLIMEPAAMKLNYWQWTNNFPPVQNFIVWFVGGGLMTGAGILTKTLRLKGHPMMHQFYFAQLLYFVLVLVKPLP